MKCGWHHQSANLTPCQVKAARYAIFGCLNLHVTEIPFCWEHADIWVGYAADKGVNCARCGAVIEDYMTCRTSEVVRGEEHWILS